MLGSGLGAGFRVIEEGLSGRTTVFEDPITPGRRGDDMLGRLCESHAPLDLVIIMLGTNDFKHRCNANPWDIAKALEKLARLASQPAFGRAGRPPRILLVAPPPLGNLGAFSESFAGGAEKSRRLAGFVEGFAKGLGCGFLDAGRVVATSDIDGSGEMRTFAVIAMVPMIIVFVAFQKHFTQGITMGAVKG